MIKEDSPKNYKSDKIVSLAEAVKKSAELRKQGKKVGLCHGGFDLLHPGHIKHFESAKKLCDYLFVSVTSDKFVTARKGRGRPIFSETLRAYSVASIQYVDYAFISDFERAIDVIERLKPTYYIKGPDFVEKTTPGITAEKNAAKAAGGNIAYTTDQKLSTTELIRYIQENVKREKVLLVIDRDGTLIEDVQFLGKEKNWREQVKLKKDVIDLLVYIQTKHDSIKVVISNQQGVARGYFDAATVEKINSYVRELLRRCRIEIDGWQYCFEVDASYAAAKKEKGVWFDKRYVKDKTRRKPNPEMLAQALKELRKDINDFDKVVVIGNNEDDAQLAKNTGAAYIDVNGKDYSDMKNEFDRIMK